MRSIVSAKSFDGYVIVAVLYWLCSVKQMIDTMEAIGGIGGKDGTMLDRLL